jgi:hypothetical protein
MSARLRFKELIQEHEYETGFEMPEMLECYVVDLLTDRLHRVDIIPEPSFAERYLQLYNKPSISAMKDYADSALFFCSLMPEYGRRRGLSMDYYATLGISTYYTAGDLAPDVRFTQLGNWFYHLQKFINSAINPDVRLELYKF